jgi:hypothetical protein
MTPAWVGASRAANARAEPTARQAFGSTGTTPPFRSSTACKGMAQGHFLLLPFDLTGIPYSINDGRLISNCFLPD